MITMPATEPHPYPTEYLAGLLPSICRELGVLRRIVADSPSASATSTDPCNHTALLDLAESLIDAARPAFNLFFSHPTQRLSGSLILQAAEMTRPSPGSRSSPRPIPYAPARRIPRLLRAHPGGDPRFSFGGRARGRRARSRLPAPETLN